MNGEVDGTQYMSRPETCAPFYSCSEPNYPTQQTSPLINMTVTNGSKMSLRQQSSSGAKCAVCNDDASGFHYGVDSCEGCKGFFRRCITQGINFRCSNEEKCQITPFTRNSCQYCRLKKCFQVGMSREATRLGRRPKKVLKSSVMSREFQAQLTKHINTNAGSSSSSPTSHGTGYPDLATAAISDMFGCSPDTMRKISKMMPSMMAGGGMPGMAGIAGMGTMPGMGTMSRMGTMPFRGMPSDFTVPQSSCPPVDLSCNSAKPCATKKEATGEVTHMDLNKWREQQLEVMSKYMHNKEQSSSAVEVAGSDGNSMDTTTGPSDTADSLGSSPISDGNLCSPPTSANIDFNIRAMSGAQTHRMDLFRSYSMMERKEEMVQLIADVEANITESHLEHCYHQRPRINAVSAELDVKEQSGEDVRPPTGFWAHWMSELLPTIERVVRFLKDVPGFRELPMNDQILLIKKGAFDVVLSQAMPMVNYEKQSMLDPQLKYRNTRKDFENMPGPFRKLFENYFVLSEEFAATGITDVETGLINAILGVNSAIEGFQNAIAVEKLECLFVQTLYDYVRKSHPDEPGRFESLIRLIPLIDNASQAHATSLHKIKGNVPPAEQPFPELHDEIFS